MIVALTIPFALLFASICLDLKHIPANLLSLGALDFGMVVEGAVVMIENIVRHLSHHRREDVPVLVQIREAAHEVQRPVFFPIVIIITAYLPIFTLQSVEGKLFKPMAWTVAFALLGALVFSMLLAPVLASFFFRKGRLRVAKPGADLDDRSLPPPCNLAHRAAELTIGGAVLAIIASAILVWSGAIGSEFLPHLDEGAIWVRGTLAPSTGPTESIAVTNRAPDDPRLLSRSHRRCRARPDGPMTALTGPASSTPNTSSISSPRRNGGPSFIRIRTS